MNSTNRSFLFLAALCSVFLFACGQDVATSSDSAAPPEAKEAALADANPAVQEPVEFEPAYPADVDKGELTAEDVEQQEATHSHDGSQHSHDEGDPEHGDSTGTTGDSNG